MQWFRHDSSASQDFKIKRLRLKHGFWGYGLYWYIIERIQGEVNSNNTSFTLEDDVEIIALDWRVSVEEVQEAIDTMVSLKLFYISNNGQLVCPALARRLTSSMTSNQQMRKLIGLLKEKFNSHDWVMMESCKKEKKDKNRIDKNRIDKKILDESRGTTSEQTDIITNHQPPQAKEVNQADVFQRAIDNSASTIGGQVVPIQGGQPARPSQDQGEFLSPNWSPNEVAKARLYQKGIPEEYINEKADSFKIHHTTAINKLKCSIDKWNDKFFNWVNRDWCGDAGRWKSSEQLKSAGNQATATATLNQMMSNDW